MKAAAAQRKFHQLDLAEWPRGLERAIAVVALEPRELAARCGLRFEMSGDDLDAFEGALLGTPSGKHFALVRHRGAPLPGTEVWAHSDSVDLSTDLQEALHVLDLTTKDLAWTHPNIRRSSAKNLLARH
jgi:hypothetical protein